MIKIIYIPNRFQNKIRSERFLPYVPDKKISEYLSELTDLKIDVEKHNIIVDGAVVGDSFKPTPKNQITVTPSITGPVAAILMTVASYAFPVVVGYGTALTVITTAIGLGIIGLAGYAIYSAISMACKKPSMGTTTIGIEDSSPTYSWEGIQNTRDINLPVGVVYGEHRVGGNIINEYVWTDGDLNYLNMLIAVSEGEIDSISDVYINDQPVANYDGVTINSSVGTNSQAIIPNFEDLHNTYSQNTTLAKSSAVTYTTHDSDVEGFELHLSLPNGLFQQDTGSGGILSWECTYQVRYKLHSAGTWTDLGVTTISDKNRTALRRIFRKDGLTAGQYDIEITKTSDDSGFYKTGDLVLTSVDEIKTDDLIYPNTALLSVRALATNQLSGASPTITCIVKGRKVLAPNVVYGGANVAWEDYYYDSASSHYKRFSDGAVCTWDGSTYIAQFCANPIWIMKDLLTSTRYGLGGYIDATNIDAASFVEMSQYCEEKVPDGIGGYEKRFRMDVVLDSNTSALDIISQLSATFHGFAFFSQGIVKLKIDKAESPSQLFGMGNIVENSFAQSWKSIKEKPTCINISFVDKDKNYEQEMISVIDEVSLAAGEPLKTKDVRIFTTRTSQAVRTGRYLLNVGKLINRAIKFNAGIDAIAIQAGDIIDVSHDVPQFGFSGRVVSGTSSSVTLDQSVTLVAGKTYKIEVRFANGTIEEKTVTNIPGTFTAITISGTFTTTPAAYDVYAIGEVDIQSKPFRVVSLSRTNTDEVEINAMEYDAAVYDDTTPAIPTNNYSALNFTIPPVTDLKLTERLVKLADGSIEDAIDVWFNKPDMSTVYIRGYEKARIYLSDDDGVSWMLRGESTTGSFSIVGGLADGQEYTVAVTSVSFDGQESPKDTSPSATITLVGKSAAPSNVTGFIVRQSRDRLYFTWTHIDDVDLSGYEIRYGESWSAGEVIASNIKLNNFIALYLRTGSAQSYWIKAIDTSGNYSTTETEGVITIDNIPFTNIINSYSEETAWGGTKVDTQAVGNNLEVGIQLTNVNTVTISSGKLVFSGTNYLTAADSAKWTWGTGNFTIRTKINFSNASGTQGIFGQVADADNRMEVLISSGELQFLYRYGGVTRAQYRYTWNPSTSTDYHIEMVRSGSNFYLFIDGDLKTWSQINFAIGTNDLADLSAVLSVGCYTSINLIGKLWQIEIAKGIARHTASFTPPSSISADAYSVLLIQGDAIEDESYILTGTYVTPVRDIGYVATCKVGINAVATISGDTTFQDYGDQTFAAMGEDVRFSGTEQPGAVTFEIKTSEDNVTWSAWIAWTPGDYKFRYFQLRMTLTRSSPTDDLQCSAFDYYADLPDVDDFGTDTVSVASSGKAVTFNKTYHKTPSVNIDVRSGSAYLHKFSVVPDTTGFTVKLYDLAGTAQTGDFAWSAHGV